MNAPLIIFLAAAIVGLTAAWIWRRVTLAGQVTRMSIHARAAFGLVCLERAAGRLDIRSPELDQLIQRLWSKLETGQLEDWGCGGAADDLPPPQRDAIGPLLHELDEIGSGNLYGAFRNEYTLIPTLNLAGLLKAQDIPLPPRQPFIANSPRRWWDPWGQAIDTARLRRDLEGWA